MAIIECDSCNVETGRANTWRLYLDRAPRKPAFQAPKRKGREPRAARTVDQTARKTINEVDQNVRDLIDHPAAGVNQNVLKTINGVDQNTRKVCAKPSINRKNGRSHKPRRMSPAKRRRLAALDRRFAANIPILDRLTASVRARQAARSG